MIKSIILQIWRIKSDNLGEKSYETIKYYTDIRISYNV